jgi:hypothetical protein
MRKRVLCTLVAVLLLAMVVPYAFADNVVVIQNYGARPSSMVATVMSR